MVDQTQRLSRYRELIQELNETKKMEIARRTVELFFSFDIVNSSLYKTINYTGWYNVIISLFKEIQASVMKLMPGAEMWRVLGDEIVFIIPIKENKDFFVYTDKIFEILNIFVLKLKNGQFFDELEIDNDKKLLMKMQNVISLKAAAWIAIVGENVQQIERYDNLLERYKLREGYGLIEFLGNDIDAGFRIKKETENRRMVISFELAYILAKDTDYLKNIHIITYKTLRGIWQNRLYPIIWYHDPKYAENIQFEDSFFYDETEENELTKEYFSNRENSVLKKEMYYNVYNALNKIVSDQNLIHKFVKMDKIIEDSPTTQTAKGNLLEPKFFLRLHCVAVCYDKSTKKILIMKRSSKREKYPDKWEFGCAKAVLERSLNEQIEQEYYNDFGVKIKVVCDEEREDVLEKNQYRQSHNLFSVEVVYWEEISAFLKSDARILQRYYPFINTDGIQDQFDIAYSSLDIIRHDFVELILRYKILDFLLEDPFVGIKTEYLILSDKFDIALKDLLQRTVFLQETELYQKIIAFCGKWNKYNGYIGLKVQPSNNGQYVRMNQVLMEDYEEIEAIVQRMKSEICEIYESISQ